MKERFRIHPWKVLEDRLEADDIRFSESLMSLGNGYMGLRGNFEEDYSGDTHRGTYLGGVWFPDKTRVGWWKNGYPRYFGKVINAVNLIGLHIKVNGQVIDLANMPVLHFARALDMRRGVLVRESAVQCKEGAVHLRFERFVSMRDMHCLALSCAVRPEFEADIDIVSYLDGRVRNEDSNYDETFWQQLDSGAGQEIAHVTMRTRENPFGTPRFTVSAAFAAETNMAFARPEQKEGYAAQHWRASVKKGEEAALCKLVSVYTDRDMPAEEVPVAAQRHAAELKQTGYREALSRHEQAWQEKWSACDVTIQGDDEAQQGIRFNLFHLLSTYTGDDARLNIGPKGFTGEKYGGATYWDTEAFCFPVYMAVAGEQTARQLLLYRHGQLKEAYENARQQGLPGALYPMVTFTGIECHNEWEITFMELHRNAAIAHAIFNYTTYTGDFSYIQHEGLEVLLGIARFWAGRVHFSERRQRYMLHGVTGPNEYENNVNNNWYTNRMAAWCLTFCVQAVRLAGDQRQKELGVTEQEIERFKDIAERMYYAVDEQRGIFVQHDTFLDKELCSADSLPREDRPLNQHWSWDRILRSCFIKQADVLQGLYMLNHLYDKDTKRRNFEFYEPMTVHESSLSPCVHAVLAAELGMEDKAVEMYRRTARLDLDNVNNDTADGLHITSMSGGWLSIAQGFAGMRTAEGLSFAPMLPGGWQQYSFRFLYRGRVVLIAVQKDRVILNLESGEPLGLTVWGKDITLKDRAEVMKKDCLPLLG